ncbi:Hypothetical protein NTJ_15111 [Nesidiocoris tenuis]|uniref:Uncharacterized protein n=1 Tax=Nesidiocoris tenuis TaxID=355587 RepID=A0ABN7BH60_9HEMI|nr:Hypothetical protein NTJ_15111 [Nesidiocoris tenuis]
MYLNLPKTVVNMYMDEDELRRILRAKDYQCISSPRDYSGGSVTDAECMSASASRNWITEAVDALTEKTSTNAKGPDRIHNDQYLQDSTFWKRTKTWMSKSLPQKLKRPSLYTKHANKLTRGGRILDGYFVT